MNISLDLNFPEENLETIDEELILENLVNEQEEIIKKLSLEELKIADSIKNNIQSNPTKYLVLKYMQYGFNDKFPQNTPDKNWRLDFLENERKISKYDEKYQKKIFAKLIDKYGPTDFKLINIQERQYLSEKRKRENNQNNNDKNIKNQKIGKKDKNILKKDSHDCKCNENIEILEKRVIELEKSLSDIIKYINSYETINWTINHNKKE